MSPSRPRRRARAAAGARAYRSFIESRVTDRSSGVELSPCLQALAVRLRSRLEPLAVGRPFDRPVTGGATAVLLEPDLYRFPALDPGGFRRRVEEVFGSR